MHDVSENGAPGASWLLSGVYCMLVVVLSFVMCSTHYITPDITQVTVDVYYIFLCIVGCVWLLLFKPLATSCCREPRKFKEVKSTHTTNRWLKGILIFFGVAIITKDVLDFLTIFEYEDYECRKVIYYLSPLAQIIFIISEVNFLFRFSKIHLQQHKQLSRYGIMHVIATNLSIWMLVIIDEAMLTVQKPYSSASQSGPSEIDDVIENTSQNTTLGNNSNLEPKNHPQGRASGENTGLYSPSGCACNTSYCAAVHDAHAFLYPFLIEFSLVSSCMMYVVWKNVGSRPKHSGPSVKPAYKFYKSYKGVLIGSVILIGAVAALLFIENIESTSTDGQRDYDTETTALIITNSYMVFVELLMLASCIFGLALYKSEPRQTVATFNLDAVLLLVTITSSATLDIYYIFSVYASLISSLYDYNWIWGGIYPIIDLGQCIVQVAFILYGLSRAPVVEDKSEQIRGDETDGHVTAATDSAFGNHDGYTNSGFKNDNAVIEVRLESEGEIDEHSIHETSFTDSLPTKYDDLDSDVFDDKDTVNEDEIEETEQDGGKEFPREKSSKSRKARRERRLRFRDQIISERIRQHNERPSIAPPNTIRLMLRETVMFLLIANASLWLFWSLEGTAFKLYTYPHKYYGLDGAESRNTWQTVSMICLPLSIFFRMHSCACLFELWSFT